MTKETYWLRYQNLRNRLHAIDDDIAVAGFDLEAVARNLPPGSYPERDLDELVKRIDELAEHVREVRDAARMKYIDGVEADARIDALIAGTRDPEELAQYDREVQEAAHIAAAPQ